MMLSALDCYNTADILWPLDELRTGDVIQAFVVFVSGLEHGK